MSGTQTRPRRPADGVPTSTGNLLQRHAAVLIDPSPVFPPAEISVSLLSVIVTFCGIVLLSVSLFVSWKLCWLPWRDKEGVGLSLTSGLLPGSAGVGGLGGGSLLPPLVQRKDGHSSSSLYPSLGQHHPHFSDLVGLERGEVGGLVGGPHDTQEPSYLDMDTYPNNAGERFQGGVATARTPRPLLSVQTHFIHFSLFLSMYKNRVTETKHSEPQLPQMTGLQ